MKILLGLLTLLLCTTGVFAQKNIAALTGTWEAVDSENATAGIQVVDSAHIFLIYGREKKPVVQYHADFSKTPAWFDFTVQNGSNTIQLRSLIQFVNDNLVQWQIFEGTTRPVHFAANEGDVLYLRRKK